MKIYHFVLAFTIIAIGVIVITDMTLAEKSLYDRNDRKMDKCLAEAVNAAAWELRASGTIFDSYTESRVIDSLYNSFYASLGIMDDPTKPQSLGKYIPQIIVTLKEGYFIYRYEPKENSNEPYECYIREGILLTGHEPNEISVAAFITEYPLEGYSYSGYKISVSGVANIKFD